MTIENKRRELFEGVFSMEANLAMSDDHPGEYQADFVRHYWYAFNAALDAVVIELQPEDERGRITRTGAIRAIESTGLGLKVTP